jgi:hypothetical protein
MFSKSPRLANSSVKKSQSVEGGRHNHKKGKKKNKTKTRRRRREEGEPVFVFYQPYCQHNPLQTLIEKPSD